MKRNSQSPEAYRDDVPGEQRELLEAIRAEILQVAPDISEGIEYGMLDYPGLANLAAQKHYVALYVASSVLSRHKAAFTGLSSGKSCLRFKKLRDFDALAVRKLLADVLEFRSRPGQDPGETS